MADKDKNINPFAGWTVIDAYTRADAIADGELVDVSKTAKEAGFRFPVAVSRAVWSRYVAFDPAISGQDEAGRLWDIVSMLRWGIKQSRGNSSTIMFQLHVAVPEDGWRVNEGPPARGSDLTRETHRLVTLKAVCGPGDTPAPVITVMLPDED